MSEHTKLSVDQIGEAVLTAIIMEKLVQVTLQGTMQWSEKAPAVIGQAVRSILVSDSEQERAIQCAASNDLVEELMRRHSKGLVYLETPCIQAGVVGDDGSRLFMLRFKPDRMTGIGITETVKAMILSRELAASMIPHLDASDDPDEE